MRKFHPFEPVWNEHSKILILGSMPSVVSVQRGFYYMHPSNRFWKMLGLIYNENVYDYQIKEKKDFILKHNLALFDVIESCDIINSSDQSITKVLTNRIEELIDNSQISKIILNGKKAYELFVEAYPNYLDMAICLPSTSSANASYSLERLVEEWQKVLN